MSPSRYAPNEITIFCFYPYEKSSHVGHRGQTAKLVLSLAIIRYSAYPLVCYALEAEFLGGESRQIFHAFHLMKIFLHPKTKICPSTHNQDLDRINVTRVYE